MASQLSNKQKQQQQQQQQQQQEKLETEENNTQQNEEQNLEIDLFKKEEFKLIFESENPKQMIEERLKVYQVEANRSNFKNFNIGEEDQIELIEEENFYWSSQLIINKMNFLINQLQIQDYTILSRIVNAYFKFLNVIQLQEDREKFQNQDIMMVILQQLFMEKQITKDQIKQILEYIRTTYYRHKLLYQKCLQKQEKVYKKLTLYKEEPQTKGSLDIDCREIRDEQEEEEQRRLLEQQQLQEQLEQEQMEQEQQQEEEQEDEVDPEDPLYGLDLRLKNLNLDQESISIIKEKLFEANNKIKTNLNLRQQNLDSKLSEKVGKKK